MQWFSNLRNGIKALLFKQQVEAELDEEIDSYLEDSAAHKQQLGLSPEEARLAALAELGSRNSVKHRVWASRWESGVDNFLEDVRISLRMLLRRPGFTAVALFSLALGIGANTAIFTLLHQLLLRDLPVRAPEQLVTLGDATNSGVAGGIDVGQYGMFSWDFAHQLAANPGPFQGIASFGSFTPKVSFRTDSAAHSSSSGDSALLASASLVSGNYFDVLGARPLVGRTITPADDMVPGAGAVAVLSFHFWQHFLEANPAILGETVIINGTSFEVIGIMPREFKGFKQDSEPSDLWVPSTMQPVVLQMPSLLTPNSTLYFMNVFARLSPEAVADKGVLAQTQNWLNQQVRAKVRSLEGSSISTSRLQEIDRDTVPLIPASGGVSALRGQYGKSLQVLMAVVALVLFIACANLANFLLARTSARRHEIATRLALGSSRIRIARQGLVETLLLSLAGGILGLGVAFTATRLLISFVSQGSSYIGLSPIPDSRVLLFTLAVSVLTAILFGLAPAIAGARTEAQGVLNSGSRSAQGGKSKLSRLWPRSLVIGQVTFSLLLLVGAGLFLRTLRNLQNQDYGFERTSLLLAAFDEQLAGYTPGRVVQLHHRLLERLSAIPGVRSAALSENPPISLGHWRSNISIAGYTPAPKEKMNSILGRVSGRYFETAGISIVAGRPITPQDSEKTIKVAVVNQTLARHFFPKGDALGHSLTIGIDSVQGPWQIVGIARDSKISDPHQKETEMMTYIPLDQIEPFAPVPKGTTPTHREENQDRFASYILLRTNGDPAARIADMRAAVAAVDPHIPLLKVRTIDEEVSGMMSDGELSSSLTSIFASLALVLAGIGLYGVMSYNVIERTGEIGVRMALGAQTSDVLWLVLKEALVLLAVGLSLGLPLSLSLAKAVKQQLFDLSPADPWTYAFAVIGISAVILLSSWLPARRASSINPVEALRQE